MAKSLSQLIDSAAANAGEAARVLKDVHLEIKTLEQDNANLLEENKDLENQIKNLEYKIKSLEKVLEYETA